MLSIRRSIQPRLVIIAFLAVVPSWTVLQLYGSKIPAFSIHPTQGITDGYRHDTFDAFYRNPTGAVKTGATVKIRFRTGKGEADGVSLRVYLFDTPSGTTLGPLDSPLTFEGSSMENGVSYDIWVKDLPTPSTPTIVYYKFRAVKGNSISYYSDAYADDNDNLNQGGDGATSINEPFPSFQITVYDSDFTTPGWIHDAIVYHIFPDRFRNGDQTNDYGRPGSSTGSPLFYGSQTTIPRLIWNEAICDPRKASPCPNAYGNQFYGGDLKGIEDKLDYIQSLGFNTIYLNPIFKARSNHRYDTDNYLEIDPALGGEAAFNSLISAMNTRGMKLILDGVFNHASSDSVYFDRYRRYGQPAGACQDVNSPYRNWFIFFSNFTPCRSQDYSGWFGFDSLPEYNDSSQEVRNFIYRNLNSNVTKYWYGKGAGGWRFDTAPDISHNFWNDYRGFAKSYKPDGPLIGEIFPDASQYLAGDQFDGSMNYRFRKNVLGFARGSADWTDNDNNGNNRIIPLSPSQFDRAVKSIREDYPLPAQLAMLNLIDSHDTNRALFVLTIAGDNGLIEAKERLKLAAILQFTWYGAPMVYYGDEAAINAPSTSGGSNGPEDDPYNRAPYPWSDESGSSSVYGPADRSMILFYSRLGRIRNQLPALRTGDFQTLLTGDATASNTDNDTYAFLRSDKSSRALVALNNGSSNNISSIPVSSIFPDGSSLQDTLTGNNYLVSNGLVTLNLPPRSGVILSRKGRK